MNDVGDIDLNEVVKSLCRLLQYGIRKSQYWERTWRASRSSESEISDGPDDVLFQGAGRMKGSEKVRLLALTCFQVLIKHNSKLLHQYWHKLLPDVDVNLVSVLVKRASCKFYGFLLCNNAYLCIALQTSRPALDLL